MKVSRKTILLRGLQMRCPQCGAGKLFERGFRMLPRCKVCDLIFERGSGFYLGAMTINYGIVVFLWLLPVALLALFNLVPVLLAVILAVGGAIFCPILLYRYTRALWLAVYFFLLPHELPVNQTRDIPVDEVEPRPHDR